MIVLPDLIHYIEPYMNRVDPRRAEDLINHSGVEQ